MSSFTQRLLSSILLIPLILLVLWIGGFVFKAFVAVIMVMAFYEFFMMARLETVSVVRYGLMVACGLYCLLGFFAAVTIPVWFILIIFLCVWASDSGAYAFGKTLGGPKLAPRISPNKTIAGLVGACLAPFAVLLLVTPDSPTQVSLVYGVVIGVIGQAGDIMVSALKRRAGVKDTGRLIPGHGGILDRIDALILVLIIFWIGLEGGVIIWPDNSTMI